MKRKALFSSVLTIVLCLCLIAGSTFALFTSEDTVDIDITAGKVDVSAGLENLKLYSAEAAADGTLVDENEKTYKHTEQTTNFANGGTATFDETTATLAIDRITPGDKVEFEITRANESDVAIQYRYIVELVEGYKLMSGLVVTINGVAYESLDSFTSAWATLDAATVNAGNTELEPIKVAIELPISAGNEYQEQSVEIRIVVEAVQGNASIDDAEKQNQIVYIEQIGNASEASDAIVDSISSGVDYILLTDDIANTIVVNVPDGEVLANKTIDACGNDVSLAITGAVENLVITGITADSAKRSVNVSGVTGDVSITNSTLISGNGTGASAIGHGANVNVSVDNCDISSDGSKKSYGLYYSGASGSLIITNSTFTGFGSWAITSNNTINGDVVIDNCVFDTQDGVFKTLGGGITGDFTFTNNTMIGCYGHDGSETNPKLNNLVVSGSGPVVCGGTKTVANNTRNGEAWTQE